MSDDPDDLRQMLQTMFAEDDAARREHELWEVDFERRRQQLRQRQAPDLIYKRNENARPQPQHPVTAAATTMSAEDSSRWNKWLWKAIESGLKQYDEKVMIPFAREAGKEIAIAQKEMRAEFRKEIEELQRQLGELRADAEVRRAAEIFDLPDFRKRANG